MSNFTLSWSEEAQVPMEQTIKLEFPIRNDTVAVINDESETPVSPVFKPDAIRHLTGSGIKVFMQHGFAAHAGYSDMEYADVGVEFIDDLFILSRMTRVAVKFTPPTSGQIEQMPDRLILFSPQSLAEVRTEHIQALRRKKISAISMNFIWNDNYESIYESILSQHADIRAVSASVQHFLLPLLTTIVTNTRLRFALQKDPGLLHATYCFNGFLCNAEIADKLHLPYKDIVSLCWQEVN